MKSNKGNIVIEATIVMPIVVFVIGMLLYIAILYYQHNQVVVTANKTANAIGKIYDSSYKDPFLGYVTKKDLKDTELYRNIDNIFSGELSSINETKGKWYALYTLGKNRYLAADDTSVDAKIETLPGAIAKKRIRIEISETYSIPIIKFFGLDSHIEFHAISYSECYDIIDYLNLVEFAKTEIDELNFISDTNTYKIVKWFVDLINGGL